MPKHNLLTEVVAETDYIESLERLGKIFDTRGDKYPPRHEGRQEAFGSALRHQLK